MLITITAIAILPVIYHIVIGDLGIVGDVITGITAASSAYLIGQSASDSVAYYKNRKDL